MSSLNHILEDDTNYSRRLKEVKRQKPKGTKIRQRKLYYFLKQNKYLKKY